MTCWGPEFSKRETGGDIEREYIERSLETDHASFSVVEKGGGGRRRRTGELVAAATSTEEKGYFG